MSKMGKTMGTISVFLLQQRLADVTRILTISSNIFIACTFAEFERQTAEPTLFIAVVNSIVPGISK